MSTSQQSTPPGTAERATHLADEEFGPAEFALEAHCWGGKVHTDPLRKALREQDEIRASLLAALEDVIESAIRRVEGGPESRLIVVSLDKFATWEAAVAKARGKYAR